VGHREQWDTVIIRFLFLDLKSSKNKPLKLIIKRFIDIRNIKIFAPSHCSRCPNDDHSPLQELEMVSYRSHNVYIQISGISFIAKLHVRAGHLIIILKRPTSSLHHKILYVNFSSAGAAGHSTQ